MARINFLPPWVETNLQPAFYDLESGTCLQQTARMYDKVNQLVRSVNDQNDTIADYIQQFIDLKDYVDEYFENLDVQAEINTKLDNMATDGSLTALIKAYVDPIQESFEEGVNNTISSEFSNQNQRISHVETLVASSVEGTPIAVTSVDDMTDTDRIYVNTSDGYWYYYDGEDWTQGGQYQSTGIALASIIGNMVKDKTITKDKLNNLISVLSLATDIYPGKAVTNFYSGTGLVFTDNVGSNSVIFDLDDVNSKVVYFKIDATKTTGDANIDKVIYNSGDLTAYNKIHYTQIVADAKQYDSTLGWGAIKHNTSGTYNKVALTLNANWDIFTRESYTKPSLITGENIKIDATDMRTTSNVYEGLETTGYADNSNYLPLEQFNQGFNKLLIELTQDNMNKIRESYLYVPDPDSTITKRIILYKENVRGRMLTLNNILQSDGYNPVTKRCNLGILLRNYLDLGYDYIAIYYESNITETPLYTTYMDVNNPNYSVVNQGADYELVIPNKIKAVENQTMCFYFQNAIRYQNSDLIGYKTIGGARFNNQRVSLLDTTTTGENTVALTTKKSYIGSTISSNFSYDVVPANAGNGVTKKVLMIGDSLTAAGRYTERLLELFGNDVMNITLLGTMTKDGNPLNRYEGRGGWGTDDYTTNSTYAGYTNPFWNPDESAFDFSYYMSEQGYTDVDYVFINLGTNDLTLQPTATVNNLNTMIASIKDYDSNIKIGLWLPPLRGISEQVSSNYLNDLFEAMRVNKLFIDTYTSDSNVYLIPVCYNVNPYEDYPISNVVTSDMDSYGIDVVTDKTHPVKDGYYHIGDVLYAWIKYLATL